ncbi:2200_t:CDS:2, partial [Scutellospora calospora]
DGSNIVEAAKNLAETYLANIEPSRNIKDVDEQLEIDFSSNVLQQENKNDKKNENLVLGGKGGGKRMKQQVKDILEYMFLNGNSNPQDS